MSADREVAETNIEPADAVAAAASTPVLCANCGALLSGHYCARCGQRVEHAVHSLSHFLREVAEDLTHADSRLWRTIGALLFKPGYLTREFEQAARSVNSRCYHSRT